MPRSVEALVCFMRLRIVHGDVSGADVESHQPSPATQHVSSIASSIRNDLTAASPPPLKAAVNLRPSSEFSLPTQDMKPARDTKHAGQIVPLPGLPIQSMPPKPPSACSGNSSLPPTWIASGIHLRHTISDARAACTPLPIACGPGSASPARQASDPFRRHEPVPSRLPSARATCVVTRAGTDLHHRFAFAKRQRIEPARMPACATDVDATLRVQRNQRVLIDEGRIVVARSNIAEARILTDQGPGPTKRSRSTAANACSIRGSRTLPSVAT